MTYSHTVKKFLCVCALAMLSLLVCPDMAHAGYLDPGSGSTLVQGIIAIIAAYKRIWKAFVNGLCQLIGYGKKQ